MPQTVAATISNNTIQSQTGRRLRVMLRSLP
jgi:hypothetical protein